jgi:hypothetical protein
MMGVWVRKLVAGSEFKASGRIVERDRGKDSPATGGGVKSQGGRRIKLRSLNAEKLKGEEDRPQADGRSFRF